jgi:Tetratricopeptide repeat
MSEVQEDIIIIEDSDAAEALENQDEYQLQEDNRAKKNKTLIFGGIGLLLLIIITLVMLIIFNSSEKQTLINMDPIDEKLEEKSVVKVEPSRLENMIAKANYLYTTGSKTDALSLYEKIAQYSEAISEYNLGVAQLKEKQYKLALSTFAKAIKNDEKRCVSAINAAVCSIHLNDHESFKYYIDLAYAYLPNEINSPLYSYYYALINYYNQNYLASLNALKNSTSNEYPFVQKNLSAKINALFSNDYDAIEEMEKNFEELDDFNIALLYARVGDFTLASNHLSESIIKNIQPVKSQLALGLINLKAGQVKEAAKQIQNVTDMFPEEIYKHYPIKVKLQDSLFDPTKAQQVYRDEIVFSKNSTYQKIFYFSPYKVFNANQTISYIRKGNANIYIDNIKSAQKYLKNSATSSSVNIGITKSIQKALDLKIREANVELQKLVKIKPKHSILQYNLALTYAQLGNLDKAHEHFLRSYYLDAKNYLSGIYAVMTAQLINEDSFKLHSILKEALSYEDESEEVDLYKTLLHISDNDYISAIEWLDNTYKERPLYLALEILISLKLDKQKSAQKAATQLTILLPNDILPHILYIDSYYNNLKPIKYAAKVLSYLREQKFNFNDLYYGPYITRYLYIQVNLITGKLYFLREQLKSVLSTTSNNTQEIESALAMASLFDKQFEESYTLYNNLIDESKMRDAYTLFLGAVASTAADHHANAIALLELSKMKNKNFYDSRYALALLYLEIENNEGATIELSKIDVENFRSKFFDFEIDTKKLLYKKQHP